MDHGLHSMTEEETCKNYRYNDRLCTMRDSKSTTKVDRVWCCGAVTGLTALQISCPCIVDRERCGKVGNPRGQTTRGKVGYVMFALFANPTSTTFGKHLVWTMKVKHNCLLLCGA